MSDDVSNRPAPTITREDTGSGGRWVTRVDGHEAEMTFSRVSDTLIIIDHTGVPEALGGRAVGLALLKRAVEDARAAGFKIMPLCPFAKAQLEKHPEWSDVVHKRG